MPASQAARLSTEQRRRLDAHTRANPRPGARYGTMAAASQPQPLKRAKAEPPFAWRIDGNTLSIDDYLQRQPVMALLVAKDGEVVYEHYQFGLSAGHHYLSQSMAKSLVGLALGYAQAEGRIPDLNVPLQRHVPELQGTAYGETTLRNLLRMGSGVRYTELQRPGEADDNTRFNDAMRRLGIVRAARANDEREVPQGSRFHYAGVEPAVLSAAVRGATGMDLTDYLGPRLWHGIGAEGPAYWEQDPTGLSVGKCCLTALPRDWLRLGIVLANDGRRPDTGRQAIPREFLLETTDWHRFDPPFRPGRTGTGSTLYGYQNFFWVLGTEARRFKLDGLYGQAVFVDPALHLVMVHLAVNGSSHLFETSMGREQMALWRGVVEHYGRW